MGQRWRVAAVGAAAIAVAAACQGTPRSDFNAGQPVAVPSWPYDSGLVLRGADGSTFISRKDPSTGDDLLRKLQADGSVDTLYGSGGDASTGLASSMMESGPTDGVVLADGSTILIGGLNFYQTGSRRFTPTGQLDPTYGDAGTRVVSDAFAGTGADVCRTEASGSLTCLTVPSLSTVQVGGYGATGAATATTTYGVNLGQFARSGPPGTAITTTFASSIDVERSGTTTVVAVAMGSTWWTAGYEEQLGVSDRDLVLMRFTGGALDPTFGSGGYLRIDPEVAGGDVIDGGTTWSIDAARFDVAAGGAVTFWARLRDDDTGDPAATVGRVTPGGALDPAWDANGMLLVTGPGGSPFVFDEAASRAGDKVTVVGMSGGQPAVLRYTATGGLDPEFDTDGMATFASTATTGAPFGLDLRNGSVTVSFPLTDPDANLVQSLGVVALYG